MKSGFAGPADVSQLKRLAADIIAFPAPLRLPFAQQWRTTMPLVKDFLIATARGEQPDAAAVAAQLGEIKVTAERSKELVFEAVRAKHYPNAPSRMRCMFLLLPDADPIQHMKAMGFDPAARAIIEVEPAPTSRLLHADAAHLNCNLSPLEEQQTRAHAFWSGDVTRAGLVEIMLEGLVTMRRLWEGAR
jgi:hypothetical protein